MSNKWVITYANGTTSTVEASTATQAARAGEWVREAWRQQHG
jgi:hypothetical protein